MEKNKNSLLDNGFLGIIGGLGSYASAYFYELIVKKTDASTDQDNINMIILNHATIPDRTSYILGQSSENPYFDLKNDVKLLTNMGAKLIAIPCNTCHYFYNELQSQTSVKILNIIEDTVSYLKKNNAKKVAILATTGTIKSQLYQKMLQKYNIDFITLNDDMQEKVMHIIYNCIKKGKEVDKNIWNEIVNFNQDVSHYILGCTELSILKSTLNLCDNFVDPLEVAAINIVKFFSKNVK